MITMQTIIIEPTPAGTFSAYAPDVPGCVATDRIRSGEDPGRASPPHYPYLLADPASNLLPRDSTMPDPPDIICPYCGCRGHKTPHRKLSWIHSREEAEQFGWNDLACGSCGRAFRGYPWPTRSS